MISTNLRFFNMVSGLFLGLTLLLCCQNNRKFEARAVRILSFKQSTVTIGLPSTTSSNLIYPVLWSDDGEEFLATYNFQRNSIEVFNFSKKEYLKGIKLFKEGPDFISSVRSIALWGDDVFLVANGQYLTLIDFEGKVLDRLRINSQESDFTGFDFSNGSLLLNQYSGLQAQPREKTVLMECYRFGQEDDESNGFFIVELNLESKTIEVYGLPYNGRKLKAKSNYGELSGLNFFRDSSRFVINRKFSSGAYSWKGNTLEEKSVYSEFTVNEEKPLSELTNGKFESRLEHQLRAATFYPFIFDPYRELYYRVHKAQVQNINDEPDFFLTISDENFLKLEEFPLPKSYYIFPIVSKEGLFFTAFNKNDDQLELLKYEFTIE